jgi:hypothetical protein
MLTLEHRREVERRCQEQIKQREEQKHIQQAYR